MSYTLKHVFMYDSHVNSKAGSGINFRHLWHQIKKLFIHFWFQVCSVSEKQLQHLNVYFLWRSISGICCDLDVLLMIYCPACQFYCGFGHTREEFIQGGCLSTLTIAKWIAEGPQTTSSPSTYLEHDYRGYKLFNDWTEFFTCSTPCWKQSEPADQQLWKKSADALVSHFKSKTSKLKTTSLHKTTQTASTALPILPLVLSSRACRNAWKMQLS